MPSSQNSAQELLSFLRMQGPCLSSELVAHFGLSRQTLSRRVREMGHSVVTIGKGRATRLAAHHPDLRGEVPLYQVMGNGQVELIGHLHPLQAGTQIEWYLAIKKAQPALFGDAFKNGIFPGWPWFLEDLRPSGFLGRAFGQRMAKLFQIDPNPDNWSDLELLNALTAFGANLPGDRILGDGMALKDFQKNKVLTAEGYYRHSAPSTYPLQAEHAFNEGEVPGSSAGGEQPKFATMVCDTPEDTPRAVIVKFSPKLDTASGARWADLLYAEHTANEVLREAGFFSARTRTFHKEERVFLESERFDRVSVSGRRGVVSLRALDAAYIGMGNGSWAGVARKLHTGKWISEADRDRMIQLHCFGELIANTDMHWGNLSFFLPEERPYPLAPIYDMLPMRFRPSSTGEVIERSFAPDLPKPEDQSAWLKIYPHALAFWQSITKHPEITDSFKQIAAHAIAALERIYDIVTKSPPASAG